MFEGSRQSFVKSFQMTLIKALHHCSTAALQRSLVCVTVVNVERIVSAQHGEMMPLKHYNTKATARFVQLLSRD